MAPDAYRGMARPRIRQAAEVTPSLLAEALAEGMYLTDGRRLFRVLAVLETNVELEDCLEPDGLPQWFGVSEVCRKMRLVRCGGSSC